MASKNKNKSAAPKVGDASAEPKAAATAIEPGEGVTGKTSEDETKVAQASSNAAVDNAKYVALTKFKDSTEYVKSKADVKVYEAGTDVSHFSKDRLNALVNRGLVERR